MSSSTNGSSPPDESTTSNGVPGMSSAASSPTSPAVAAVAGASGEDRLRQLEALFAEGPESTQRGKTFSTETLLDILLILFNECCHSSLRKEKTVTDFIDFGEISVIHSLRLRFTLPSSSSSSCCSCPFSCPSPCPFS